MFDQQSRLSGISQYPPMAQDYKGYAYLLEVSQH